jgi:hypothetical protein
MKQDQNSVDNSRQAEDPFAALYPNIALWVKGGWIEIGQNDYSQSFVRALDDGGLAWEGGAEYSGFHEALQALDAGFAARREEQGL